MNLDHKKELRLDWVDVKAARYAVEHWHYSQSMPSGKLLKLGIWEDMRFVGVIMYGRGANNNIASPYGLNQTEAVELVRIAMMYHTCSVSKVISLSLNIIKRQSPGLRLIISYADPDQSHVGTVYQAGNWIYTGASQAQREVMFHGKVMHKRTANALFGTIKGMEKSPIMWKHKYLYPLDKKMRKQIQLLSKPYPKRVISDTGDTAGFPLAEGGLTPTMTLQPDTVKNGGA